MKRKLLTIIGARPQFIKAAALSRLLNDHPSFQEVLVHTGQHFDSNMSDIFFEELQIPQPHHLLHIAGGGHGVMTGRMLEALEPLLITEKPAGVLVYGDTNSTLAGALAAAKLHIPVIHIEAGLRSFNRQMPEENNRVLTDHLSTFLLCPTQTAVQNLSQEGIQKEVHHVGDIMADTVRFAKTYLEATPNILERFSFVHEPFALLTIHREESTGSKAAVQERLDYALNFVQQQNLKLVFPVHPRTRSLLPTQTLSALHILPPVSYFEMQALLSKAHTVLTDSGGLQKEAYFHRVPCITLRSETEWVETIQSGWNRLWTCETFKPRILISDYGDGFTAERILEILSRFL